MGIKEKFLKKIKNFFDELITFLNKNRFSKFGNNSKILYGCILNNPKLIEIEDNVFIGNHVWLNAGEDYKKEEVKLIIKKGSHISRFCHINAFNKVIIEEDALIGESVYIGDADHSADDRNMPIIKQEIKVKGKVLIRSGCHICKGSVISAGVTVGKNAVVAPGAFVTTDVPDYAMAIGSPANIIENYNQNLNVSKSD